MVDLFFLSDRGVFVPVVCSTVVVDSAVVVRSWSSCAVGECWFTAVGGLILSAAIRFRIRPIVKKMAFDEKRNVFQKRFLKK